MAKVLQTETEIAALVMHAASGGPHVKAGLVGRFGRVHDGGVPYTWNVTSMHNNTSKECEQAIETIVEGLRLMFDLKDGRQKLIERCHHLAFAARWFAAGAATISISTSESGTASRLCTSSNRLVVDYLGD